MPAIKWSEEGQQGCQVRRAFRTGAAGLALLVSGCAGLVFNPTAQDDALTYYETAPYLFISTSKDCVTTASVVALPGRQRSVSLRSGYGSADLSVGLSSGMITSVGQKTDTKIPETITAVGGLAKNLGVGIAGEAKGKQIICDPVGTLYPIVNGYPDYNHPLPFPARTRIVDTSATQ